MSHLETQNLTYVYGEGTPFKITALDNVNIDIPKGEFVAIIGHTGSGKSTLVQHLNGLLKPSNGAILLDGENIWKSKSKIFDTRFRVGLCFQYPEYQLFEETVYKDIAFGPTNMGLSNDDYLYFKQLFDNAGALDKIISFINTTDDPSVERLLVPDMALTAAEYFAVDKNEKVLVLLTDMTLYADALAIVSNKMDQIPSKDSMPGSLYSDLAKIYEKAVQFPAGGSITIIAVTTLNGGDITHAIPDNTGYITEGQLFLRKDTDVNKVIVDPFRSLSRLKQLVIGKKTREDHPQVMNTAVRLYNDASNAKTKRDNGFDLSDYDERCIEFASEYSVKLLAIDVNIDVDEMLDTTWGLFGKYFKPTEVSIKQNLMDKYWKGN